MNGKRIVVLLIVVSVIVAGAGIAVSVISNLPSEKGTGVDHINDGVHVGDYQDYDYSVKFSTVGSSYMTKKDLIGWLYEYSGTKDPIHSKEISLDDRKVMCDTYYEETEKGKNVYFVGQNDSVCYGYEKYEGSTRIDYRTLTSTSLTLSDGYSHQIIKIGTTVNYVCSDDINISISGSDDTALVSVDVNNTVTNEAYGSDWYVKTTKNCDDTVNANSFVEKIDGNSVTLSNGDEMTKDEFIGMLDFDIWLKYLNDSKITVTHGSTVTKTISTCFGERTVSEHSMVVDLVVMKISITVDYGEDGVIYKTSYTYGAGYSFSSELTGTNMVYEGTEMVSPSQKDSSIEISNVIIAVAAIIAAAIIGALVAYLIIDHKKHVNDRDRI